MHCLANICYVCFEKENKLISNIKSLSAVNKDLIDIICYPAFNLAWLKTKRIILICEECCLRLRETYQFLKMCHKNSALLQGCMDNSNTTTRENTDNKAELSVMLDLNIEHNDIHEVKCEMPDEQMYALQVEPIIEETQDVFVDFEDSVVVKEEIICKEEEVYITGEYPMDINSTEISVNSSNAHITNTDSVSSEVPCEQVHATNKKDLINTAAKKSCICTICSKSFVSNSALNIHTRVHTGEKPYQCTKCQTWFSQKRYLKYHMRTHTGEKPYKCSICEKCFSQQSTLTCHIRTHTGEKPYECLECGKCFTSNSSLHRHKRIHTGVKNHACSICEKCFGRKSYLVNHMNDHNN